jgi:hypothetical protein
MPHQYTHPILVFIQSNDMVCNESRLLVTFWGVTILSLRGPQRRGVARKARDVHPDSGGGRRPARHHAGHQGGESHHPTRCLWAFSLPGGARAKSWCLLTHTDASLSYGHFRSLRWCLASTTCVAGVINWHCLPASPATLETRVVSQLNVNPGRGECQHFIHHP